MNETKKKTLSVVLTVLLAAVIAVSCGIFSACGLFGSGSESASGSGGSGDTEESGSSSLSDEPVTVRYVGLNNFDLLYDVRDEISFDKVTLTVTYTDNSTKDISDIRISDARDRNGDEEIPDGESDAVLYTDGLYSESLVSGDHDEGEFDISCYLTEDEGTYSIGTAVIEDDIAMHLMVVMYEEPTFVTEYRNSLKERSGDATNSDDNSFISEGREDGSTLGYCVGDDNPFVFEPKLTVMHDKTYTSSAYSDFEVELAVYLINGDGEMLLNEGDDFLYAEDVPTYAGDGEDGKDSELTESEEENYYFVYSKDEFSFDFTEKAVGESFRIEMTLLGYERDFAGARILPVGMELTVCDGWNAYSALDLGRINFIDAETYSRTAMYYTNLSSSSIFWTGDDPDPETAKANNGDYESVRYDTLWRNFFAEKEECNPEDFDEVHGMFLHGNLTVTPDDIPSRYLVSREEIDTCQSFGASGFTEYNKELIEGSLRNSAELYSHCMDTDFIFNGNLFKLDFSSFKYILTDLTHDNTEQKNTILKGINPSASRYPDSDFYLFRFVGLYENVNPNLAEDNENPVIDDSLPETDENNNPVDRRVGSDYSYTGPIDPAERHVATFENTELVGNLSYGGSDYSNRAKAEGLASGSLNAVESIRNILKMDNCIVREFKMAVEASYSRGDLTGAETFSESYYCTDIEDTKFFDMYNSAEILYFSAKNKVTNCVFKRLGGPAVFLYTKTRESSMARCYEYESGCEMDDKTIVENYLACDEAWFVTNGATILATLLPLVDAVFTPMGKTIYTGYSMTVGADGSQIATPGINLIYFVMDDDFGYEMNADLWHAGAEFVMDDNSVTESYTETDLQGSYEQHEDKFSSVASYNSALTNYYFANSGSDFPAVFSTNTGEIFMTDMTEFLAGNAYTMQSYLFGGALEPQTLTDDDTDVYVFNTMSVGCGIVVTLGNYSG